MTATTSAKCRPIIMSADSVRAILDGRKTMTRRVVKPQPEFTEPNTAWRSGDGHGGIGWYAYTTEYPDEGSEFYRCRFGQPGDLLWVRETWSAEPLDGLGGSILYRATDNDRLVECWRSPLHLPRRLARLWLRITTVRVERVQEISEVDADVEGCHVDDWPHNHADIREFTSSRELFMWRWNELNAKRGYSWVSNPFVWVISFERAEPSP